MSTKAIRRTVKVFGILHLVAGLALVIGAGYCACSSSVHGGWLMVPWVASASVYFLWLGFRGCTAPSPGIIRQLCGTISLVLGLPFAAVVEYLAWPVDSVAVTLPAAIIVLGSFWLSTFGGSMFCRRLFPPRRFQEETPNLHA